MAEEDDDDDDDDELAIQPRSLLVMTFFLNWQNEECGTVPLLVQLKMPQRTGRVVCSLMARVDC